ncbi:MAG TPA: phage major capsid protein [Hyphomicrobiales bacterium]|nr:phage major capsid protein [Hyphomicrobiales bacterium]
MHTTIKTRGIYAVRASNDRWLGGAPPPAAAALTADPSNPRAALAELQAAWSDFRKEDKSRYTELQAQIADIATRNAALEINGRGGAGLAEPAALRGDRAAVAAMARTGAPMAMTVGSDPDGGYTVAPAISQSMTKRLFDSSPMRQIVRVETIGAGDAFEELVDHSDVGATWVGEQTARPTTDGPQFGKLRVEVREIYANIPISQRLLDDTSYDLGAYVEGKAADKFARTEGGAFVSGTGVIKPRGFLDYPTTSDADGARPWGTIQYVATGTSGGFGSGTTGSDKLRDLMWSLRAPYRQGARWLMSSNTANLIDKLKDGQGNYIWRTGQTAGAPNELLGFEVAFCEDMPAVADGAFAVAFGNWQLGYLAVDKPGVRWLRDPYSSKPNVLLYAYRRTGGDVANFEAIKLLKFSAS